MNEAVYLRRQQAAAYVNQKWGIPCAHRTLAKLAVVGGGPLYRKAGRIPIYTSADLDDWAQGKISQPRRTTSDAVEGQ